MITVVNGQDRHPIFSLLGSLCVCYVVGFVAAQGTNAGLVAWYQIVEKPPWAPPGWLFAPLGTAIYALMGIALWIVWRSGGPSRTPAIAVFSAQLVLCGGWPWLFFSAHLLFVSSVEVGVLWITIGLTCLLFFRIAPRAGLLMIPYLLWTLFAAGLNFAVWRLNPSGDSSIKVISSLSRFDTISRFRPVTVAVLAMESART